MHLVSFPTKPEFCDITTNLVFILVYFKCFLKCSVEPFSCSNHKTELLDGTCVQLLQHLHVPIRQLGQCFLPFIRTECHLLVLGAAGSFVPPSVSYTTLQHSFLRISIIPSQVSLNDINCKLV